MKAKPTSPSIVWPSCRFWRKSTFRERIVKSDLEFTVVRTRQIAGLAHFVQMYLVKFLNDSGIDAEAFLSRAYSIPDEVLLPVNFLES